jgi:hypothetical protein
VPTVVRVHGFEVRVISGDHKPPHVHVFHDGANIKISLSPVEVVEIVEGRPSRADVRRARRIVAEHLDACVKAFEEYGA